MCITTWKDITNILWSISCKRTPANQTLSRQHFNSSSVCEANCPLRCTILVIHTKFWGYMDGRYYASFTCTISYVLLDRSQVTCRHCGTSMTQMQSLGITWHHTMRNTEITQHTELLPLMDLVIRRHHSLFGHVATPGNFLCMLPMAGRSLVLFWWLCNTLHTSV